jgi:hypothetical protein
MPAEEEGSASSFAVRDPEELTFEVRGGIVAAKRWGAEGDADGERWIAFHGWLDNASSFDFLIPHLRSRPISFSQKSQCNLPTNILHW